MGAQIKLPLEKIGDFCRLHQIKELSLFGSVLGANFNADSDVDVLVSFGFDAQLNLMDIVQMQEELEDLFGRKVDLIEKEALKNPYLRYSILKNKEIVYAA